MQGRIFLQLYQNTSYMIFRSHISMLQIQKHRHPNIQTSPFLFLSSSDIDSLDVFQMIAKDENKDFVARLRYFMEQVHLGYLGFDEEISEVFIPKGEILDELREGNG